MRSESEQTIFKLIHQLIVEDVSVDDEWNLNFTEHDKPYKNEIKALKEWIAELEAELETKDNPLKIKNGLTGETEDVPVPIVAAKDIIDNYYDSDIEQIVGHLNIYLKRDEF